MFEKWSLPSNVCDLFPISRTTLDRFVGREDDARVLNSLIENHATIVIEGAIGVGKTSFCKLLVYI